MHHLLAVGLFVSLAACADAPAVRLAAQHVAPPRAGDERALALTRASTREADARRLLASGLRDQALEAALASLKLRQENLGPLHGDTARSLKLTVKILLRDEKGLARAEEMLRAQIAAIEAVGGAHHPALDSPLVMLSDVAARRSEWDLMEIAGTRVIALRDANRGPASPELAAALLALGVRRANICRASEGEPLSTRALGIFTANGDFAGQVRALDELARVRWQVMDDAGAKSRIDQAITLGEAHDAESKGLVWLPLRRLASMLEEGGDFASARPIRERALAATERWASHDAGAFAEAAVELGETCFALGDEMGARAAYARAHVLTRGRPEPPSHSDPLAPRCHAPDPHTGLVQFRNVANAAQVVGALSPSFRRCYNQGLKTNPNMRGGLRVKAGVGAGGQVTNATAAPHTGTISDEVAGCVLDTIMSASFAPPTGGGVTIVIPAIFEVTER